MSESLRNTEQLTRAEMDELNLIDHVTLVGKLELAEKRIAELEGALKHLSGLSDEHYCGRYVEAFRVHVAAQRALKGGAK